MAAHNLVQVACSLSQFFYVAYITGSNWVAAGVAVPTLICMLSAYAEGIQKGCGLKR